MIPKELPETIHAKKSTLRRLTMDDAEPFYRFVSHDDNVRYMFFEDEQRTKDGSRAMVEWVIDAYDTDNPVCIYAIADKVTDEYIGNLGAQKLKDSDKTELFYALLPEYRGEGYVTDAVKTFVRWLFDEGIHTAVALIIPENVASIRVMERLYANFLGDADLHGNPAVAYEITTEIVKTWS